MKVVFIYISLFCVFALTCDVEGKSLKDKTKKIKRVLKKTEADTFLETFGYLRKNGYRHSRKEWKNALRLYQHNTNLKETGKLNKATIRAMKKPRCGVIDVKKRRHRREAPAMWYHQTVTWKHSGFTKKLSKLTQLKTFQKAFREWSKYIPVRFRYRGWDPDIDIIFARYEHGDGFYNAFDGQGLVLAHAFLPGETRGAGDVHFDEDENWTLSKPTKDSSNLLYIAAHEFGHAIGLDHSSNPESVMSAYYKEEKLKLHSTDILRAQQIYGKANDFSRYIRPTYPTVIQKAPPGPPVPGHPHSSGTYNSALRDNCEGIDDLFIGADGYVHVFAKNLLYNVNETHRRPGYPILLNQNYSGVPSFIDAAEYIPELKRTYIFKGDLVWRYTDNILDLRFPKSLRGHRSRERASAAVYVGKRLFLFGRRSFWEWNIRADRVTGYGTLSIARYWKGLPNASNAAWSSRDGHIYFIKDNKYYKVHPILRKVEPGYPKEMPLPLLKHLC